MAIISKLLYYEVMGSPETKLDSQELELAHRFIDKPRGVLANSNLGRKVLELRATTPINNKSSSGMERLGFPPVSLMTEDDLLAWGDLFIIANKDTSLTEESWGILRQGSEGYTPSRRKIVEIFGSFEDFIQKLHPYSSAQEHERLQEQEYKREVIDGAIVKHSVPLELFADVSDESEIFSRYGRYIVADNIYKKLSMAVTNSAIINLAIESTPTNFTSRLRKKAWGKVIKDGVLTHSGDNPISPADVELEAKTIGFFDDIYPNIYLQFLNVEAVRQRLAQKESS